MIENTNAPIWVVFQPPPVGAMKKDWYCARVRTSFGPPRSTGRKVGWKLSTTM